MWFPFTVMSNDSNIVLTNLSFDVLVFGGVGGGSSGCGRMVYVLVSVKLVIVVVVTVPVAIATALIEMKLLYFEVHPISSCAW